MRDESIFAFPSFQKMYVVAALSTFLASFAKFSAARFCLAPLEKSDFYPRPSLSRTSTNYFIYLERFVSSCNYRASSSQKASFNIVFRQVFNGGFIKRCCYCHGSLTEVIHFRSGFGWSLHLR